MGWMVDSNGKRYRKVGNIIEYEPTIMTTNGVVSMERVGETVRTEPLKQEKLMLCPLKDLLKCDPRCVFRSGERCTFGEHGEKPGDLCPFTGTKCSIQCALYNEGCRF